MPVVAQTHGRIIDFVDTGHPALLRMWDKRQRGYQAMGYRVAAKSVSDNQDFDAGEPNEVAAAITKVGMKAGTK